MGVLVLFAFLAWLTSKLNLVRRSSYSSHFKINSVYYIDNHNKVLELSYGAKNYLILVGKSNNVLLDKNTHEKEVIK